MLKILVPAAAALGLVAFAAQTQSADPMSADTGVMGWHLSHEGTMAKLAYGVANSDQLALMITCSPGDRAAVVYGDVQPVGARMIQAAYVPAAVDPLSAGEMEETRVSLGGLRSLADDGVLAVQGDAGVFQIAATRAEQRTVSGFLAYCGSSRI